MMAASVLLVSTIVGCDMQQDRSTGWRLGSKRAIQFRYQAAGIAMGAVLCVALAKFFLSTRAALRIDTFAHPDANVGIWQSAMTYKLVGAIRGIGHLASIQVKALAIGLAIGIVVAVGRRMLAASRGYQRFIASGAIGFAIGWIVDAILLSSPYASSTGGFLESHGQPLVRGRRCRRLAAHTEGGAGGLREHVGDRGARRPSRPHREGWGECG